MRPLISCLFVFVLLVLLLFCFALFFWHLVRSKCSFNMDLLTFDLGKVAFLEGNIKICER